MQVKGIFLLLVLNFLAYRVSSQTTRIWGTTLAGGGNSGTIFSIKTDGTSYTVNKSFPLLNTGGSPRYQQLVFTNGLFYGVSASGGVNGTGVLFSWNASTNVYTNLHDFGVNGATPMGKLALFNNKLYGMTQAGGANNLGVIYEWDISTNAYNKKIDFSSAIGSSPQGGLTLVNNIFYGGTFSGGANSGTGVLFSWDPTTNVYSKLFDFTSSFWRVTGELTYLNNKLYGMTNQGGANGFGSIFEFDLASNVCTKKVDFLSTQGRQPVGSLALLNDKLYGMTTAGGINNGGVIFEYDPSINTCTAKQNLQFATGSSPYGTLAYYNGKFYGLTNAGGVNGLGALFEWDPVTNVYSLRYSFDNVSGNTPYGTPTILNGDLFAVTASGGLGQVGSLFQWNTASQVFTKKIDFNTASEGSNPRSQLSFFNSKYYGVTIGAGALGGGTIFEFNPSQNSFTTKINFSPTSFYVPDGGLTLFNNKFYGRTRVGGANNVGVLYEWDPTTNIITKKIDFNSASTGSSVVGRMVSFNNKLYGVMNSGGVNNNGSIFEYDPATNIYTKKFDFLLANGAFPFSGMTLYNNKFYGMTQGGGANNPGGVIYEWDPTTNTYTKKIDLSSSIGSAGNNEMVVFNNKLYGMTQSGGVNNRGVLFEYDPLTSVYAKKIDFDATTGGNPSQVSLETNGQGIYGVNASGGSNGAGVLFSYNPTTNSLQKLQEFSSQLSGSPNIIALETQAPSSFVPPGNTLNFDGVNDFVSIGNNAVLKPSNQITIEAWIRPTNIHSNRYYEIYRKEDGNTRHIFSFQENGTVLSFGLEINGVYSELDVPIKIADFEGQWVHVAATYDGAAKRIYRNGVQIGSQNVSGLIGTVGTAPGIIGSLGGASEFFEGSIDEFRIWNIARTAQQIQSSYLSPLTLPQNGLIAYYNFDVGAAGGLNGVATTLPELTGNNTLNGQLQNFSLSSNTSNWVESYAMVIPTAQSADNVTTNSFTAHWAAPSIGTVDNYLLSVSTTSDFNSYFTINVGNVTSYNVQGLAAATTYYYRVSGNKNSASGQGGTSNVVSVGTLSASTPSITSVSPGAAEVNGLVTISGTNFSSIAANNTVYFGGVKATVNSATPTALLVSVPAGASHQRITVTVNNLTAYSPLPFLPVFKGTGSDFSGSSFSPRTDLSTSASPVNIAPVDFDGDGKVDLAVNNWGVTSGTTLSIFKNASTTGNVSLGAKQDFTTGTGPWDVASGDFDGDGRIDLVVTNESDNSISVLRNTSSLNAISFTAKQDYVTGETPEMVVVSDFDGDGRPDIAVCNISSNTVSIFKNASSPGTVSFASAITIPVGTFPQNISTGDLDGDGRPDILTANYSNDNFSVLRNTSTPGNITFALKQDFAAGAKPWSSAIGDLDGDGKLDVVIANSQGSSVSVYKNTSSPGAISFDVKKDFASAASPLSIGLSDLNGDAKLDVITANNSGSLSLLANSSTLAAINFKTKVDLGMASGSYNVSPVDLDNDGKMDIAATNLNANKLSLFRNLGINLKDTCSLFALQFDGINDYVRATNIPSTANYTVEGWVKVEEVKNSSIIVASDARGPSLAYSHQIRIVNGRFEHYTHDNGIERVVTASNSVIAGQWYHIAITASQNGSMKLYINGVLTGTPVAVGTPWQLGTEYQFGAASVNPSDGSILANFKGKIEEVRIWDQELTANEISTWYNKHITSSHPQLSHLKAYFPLEEGTGDVTTDLISGIIGTLNNFDLSSAWVSSNSPISCNPVKLQTITFDSISDKTFLDPSFVIAANASSGLPVTFKLINGPVTLNKDTVTITGAGTVTIQATQDGNNDYQTATPLNRTFVVNKATQQVLFDSVTNKSYGTAPFTLNAKASSGYPVSFSVVSGNAQINGNIVTLTGGGQVTMRATQGGNQNYLPAFSEKSFCVYPNKLDTIVGFKQSCISTQQYYVRPAPGISRHWTLSDGGVVQKENGDTAVVQWSIVGLHTLTVQSISCDSTTTNSIQVQVTPLIVPATVSNMYPLQGTVIKTLPIALSWQPAADALLYDVYLWPDTAAIPSSPTISNTSQIAVFLSQKDLPGFKPGRTYNWKVVAKNACAQSVTPVQSFTISELPNLVVTKVDAPATAFSGQAIDVSLIVQNIGKVSTGTSKWVDYIYLSRDSSFYTDEHINWFLIKSNVLLGSEPNVAALNTGEQYNNTTQVQLPDSIIGKVYLIAVANGDPSETGKGVVTEANKFDNANYFVSQVNLTPPPDLQVTKIVTPADAFSGQNFSFSYTVTNKGTGTTKLLSWKDAVYVSADPVFDYNTAIKLKDVDVETKTYYGFGNISSPLGTFISPIVLRPDSSYTNNVNVKLPVRLFGKAYIYIVTDAENKVFEFLNEKNNVGKSDSVNIFLTPPPDFIVYSYSAPRRAAVNDSVQFNWTIKNQGASGFNDYWYDAIYISKDSTFDPSTATFLGGKKAYRIDCGGNVGVLVAAGTTYSSAPISCSYPPPIMTPNSYFGQNLKIPIPPGITGKSYLYFITDVTDTVFEYVREDNNITRAQIQIDAPDLITTSVSAPDTGWSGRNITVQWVDKNQGPAHVLKNSRQDQVYLSPTVAFNPRTAISLDYLTYDNALDSGSTLARQKTVKLPNGVFGDYYLIVLTDASLRVFENDESNNYSTPIPIHVNLSPWVDLTVKNLLIDRDTIVGNNRFKYNYTVSNIGPAALTGIEWHDRIYLSVDSFFTPDIDPLLRDRSLLTSVASGSDYNVTDSFFVSNKQLRLWNTANKPVYFFVVTDVSNAIYEYNSENNNVRHSSAVQMQKGASADLDILMVSGSDSAASGKPSFAQWTVKNLGQITSLSNNFWEDGIYLSKDTVLDAKDTFVVSKTVQMSLAKDSSYSLPLNFTVPNGLSGDYYLFVLADYRDSLYDDNRDNNYELVRDNLGAAKPIVIKLSPSPDLVINYLDAPTVGIAGQPIKIKWHILNQGTGSTEGAFGFSNKVYLSTDAQIDGTDVELATTINRKKLDVGQEYEDSATLLLPMKADINYYLILKTDASNIIYEHKGEENNTLVHPFFISHNPPSDLVVDSISGDATAFVGDSLQIDWQLKNIGINTANGYLREGVYLSEDSLWSVDDILVDDPNTFIYLTPGKSVKHKINKKIVAATPGDYYVLVKADMQNNIEETDEDNNVTASLGKLHVDIHTLPINIVTPSSLFTNTELYYKIEIPDSLIGETMKVSLTSNLAGPSNELYVSFNKIPSRVSYDLKYSNAVSPNQDITIPILQKGTYYVMAYTATPVGKENINLFARKINFEIQNVNSNTGGNTGSVTVKITGAKFEQGMQAVLSNATSDSIIAYAIKYINSTTLFATFNLTGKTTGTYNVSLIKATTQKATLANAFAIVAGSGGGLFGGGGSGGSSGGGFYCSIKNSGVDGLLSLSTDIQQYVRVGRVFPITINYGNSGNVDIPLPTRILVSLNKLPISFTNNDFSANATELLLDFKEVDGPTDVLRPGATGSIVVYVQVVQEMVRQHQFIYFKLMK